MNRIVCIGARFVPEDAAGCAVYDRLLETGFPDDLEVIDGGLGGLDLIDCLEDAQCVVFVDRVEGFGENGEVVLLEAKDVAELADDNYGHGAGLPYLLKAAPAVCRNPAGRILVLGVEGVPAPEKIAGIAALAVRLACSGGDMDEILN